ncbi:malto-oligosyltrehalose trehalohydrolase [Roseospirillum parvum]|uniref:Malto-oligosyltrehalose trehalohydrolase n=1 Tax=Roseospirillum parvum TaxID=83401 RepID=A0A1G8A174_9PROT|nr:malto-oligosyltrehalose trehalohydrolase [Roseospirillum parvum]SDH14220.1 maltooligosyltrehalose trehalohydrolase [Roseospirillum parvum]
MGPDDSPFGPRLLPGGGVRFALVAPAWDAAWLEGVDPAGTVHRRLAMARDGAGVFWVDDPEAGPHTLYRFAGPNGAIPDPASRHQPFGVDGPSRVPAACRPPDWPGRPWAEAVIAEIHVGTATPEGTFAGLEKRLDHYAGLGLTALQLMPVAAWAGGRNWGYDGVLPFATVQPYGRPEDLARLVAAAHARGLMVFLDVVYNHLGPAGNPFPDPWPGLFHPRLATPWGPAPDFSRPLARRLVIDNALHWLETMNLDGLRLDAVDRIIADGPTPLLAELAARVAELPGRPRHLILENDANQAHWLARDARGAPRFHTAQWGDDGHHAAHVLATGERGAYYGDFQDDPATHLARALAEGFAYQGEASPHRGGAPRGTPSRHLPPAALVGYLQSHDQVGNRAFGDRLDSLAPAPAVAALEALFRLAPQIPMLFMGEEWGARTPFLFFTDFEPALGEAVRQGRLGELVRLPGFPADPRRTPPPDPQDPETFAASRLDWAEAETPDGAARLARTRALLAARRRHVVPLIDRLTRAGSWRRFGAAGLSVLWRAEEGAHISVTANLSSHPAAPPDPWPGPPFWRDGRPGDPWSVEWRAA